MEQLESYGKTSVQEQTKNFNVGSSSRKNFTLDNKILDVLEPFLITDEEKERDSEMSDDEDSNYFNSLNVLLKNNCSVLQNLHLIATRESDYRGLKNTIANTIKRF